jgi:hypothetical protein
MDKSDISLGSPPLFIPKWRTNGPIYPHFFLKSTLDIRKGGVFARRHLP